MSRASWGRFLRFLAREGTRSALEESTPGAPGGDLKLCLRKQKTPADVRPRFLVAPVPPVGFEPTTHDLNVSSPLRGNEKSIGTQCAEPSSGPVGECGEAVEKRCECPCVAPDYASRIVSFLVMRYLVMKAVEAAVRKR